MLRADSPARSGLRVHGYLTRLSLTGLPRADGINIVGAGQEVFKRAKDIALDSVNSTRCSFLTCVLLELKFRARHVRMVLTLAIGM
jgi:hypothetical protein